MAVLFGLAVAGGSLVGGSGTEASAAQAAPWAAIGAMVGLIVAAIVVYAIRAATANRWSPRIPHLLLIGFIAAALGALFGASLTPSPLDADDVSPLEEDVLERRNDELGDIGGEGGETEGGTVGPVDSDGDGVPDVDSEGEPILGLDEDGDGIADVFLQPCPQATRQPEPRPGLVPIDIDCDGEVDEWVRFDPGQILRGTPPPDFGPAPSIPREEREERAAEQSPSRSVGPFVKWAAVGLVALAIGAALLALFLDRRASDEESTDDDDDENEDADDSVDGPPTVDLSESLEASLDTMLNDPDPRTGICAAYGRLLESLAEAGLPRRPEEAPEEHMQRCLNVAGLPAQPVAELLHLFSLARFSSHPITEEHRIAAVRSMRSTLGSGLASA